MNTIEIDEVYKDALIVVHVVEEHDDGSATISLDIKPEALRVVVEVGLMTIFNQAVKGAE
jgi:hypothetical protein